MVYIAVVVVSLGAVMGVGAYLQHLERVRTREVQAVAERMGWPFTAEADFGAIPGMQRFELFAWGRGQEVRNLCRIQRGDRQVTLFDYQYTTGTGKSRRTWQQTVAHVRSPRLRLPRFALRPEHVFHKIGGMFGYQDIDIPADPGFSSRYLLRGQDETAIRAAFGAGVLDFYDRNPRSCAEGADAELFFWRTEKRAKPEELPALVDLALVLADRFEADSSS